MDDIETPDGQNLAESLQALNTLRTEHRHLDDEITALQTMGVTDMLKIRRLKKLKLVLKDKIRVLEDDMTPDIIA